MNKQELEEQDAKAEEAAIALRDLIERQGVSPIDSLDELSDLWPADDDPDLLLQHILYAWHTKIWMMVSGGRSPTVREGAAGRPPSRSGLCHWLSAPDLGVPLI